MKVTIDTKEDGYEDMKKILYLLSSIMDRKGENNTSAVVDSTMMMNMFGDNSSPAPSSQNKAPDFNSLLKLQEKKEEQKKEIPKIEFF